MEKPLEYRSDEFDLPELDSSLLNAIGEFDKERKELCDFAVNTANDISAGKCDEDILNNQPRISKVPVYVDETKQLFYEVLNEKDDSWDDRIEVLAGIFAQEAEDLFVTLNEVSGGRSEYSDFIPDKVRNYYKDILAGSIYEDVDSSSLHDEETLNANLNQLAEHMVLSSVQEVSKVLNGRLIEREAALTDEDSPVYKELQRRKKLEAEAQQRQQEAIERKQRTKQFVRDVGKIAAGVTLALAANGAAKNIFKRR